MKPSKFSSTRKRVLAKYAEVECQRCAEMHSLPRHLARTTLATEAAEYIAKQSGPMVRGIGKHRKTTEAAK